MSTTNASIETARSGMPGFQGRLTAPEDPGYDEARKVYNAMIDRQPALIASCADSSDVAKVISFASDHDLLLAVRGGGHNGAGLGTCEDGVVLDLSGLKGVQVDTGARTARVGGGCIWGEVNAATNAHGLATPSGIISSTGVGGLTLGGGGNFGVITSFLFRLHDVSTVVGGPTFWPVELGAEVLAAYRDFLPNAPRELNGFFAFMSVPPAPPFPDELQLRKVCAVVWCYVGGPEDAAAAMASLLDALPEPLLHGAQPMPHPTFQSAFDPIYPAGDQWYWRANFVKEIPNAAVEVHAKSGAEMPTWQSTMHLYPIDGAAHDVGPSDTPWSYRNTVWGSVFAGVDHDRANAEAIRRWCVDYFEALHPYSAGGAYVNMMMDEEDVRIVVEL